jgi:NADH dehydrogenase
MTLTTEQTTTSGRSAVRHVLVLGGGYAGLYAAKGLRDLPGIRVTVVDPNPYMTYQPLLPEVAGGHVDPADVPVDLQRTLRGTRVLRGSLESLDHASRTAVIRRVGGSTLTETYDQVIVALGAVTRVFPTPGLEEAAIGFKTVEEALHLRNHVLDQVSLAANTTDAAERVRLLTFVFVGGGYTGAEALAELVNLSHRAVRATDNVAEGELHWVLVEALDRIAPEVGPTLSKWSLKHIRSRGVRVLLKTQVESCIDGEVRLDSGEVLHTNTLVWTAGVKPNPVLDRTDLPRGPKGHVIADARLRVTDDAGTPVPGAWAVGDNAQIPDLTSDKQPAYYPPNAQNALRQGVLVGKNVAAVLGGGEPEEYRHKSLGTVASYGVGVGAAKIGPLRLKGLPAWLAHRAYHGLAVPTVRHKVRIILGWVIEAVTSPQSTSLTIVEHPYRAFRRSFKQDA